MIAWIKNDYGSSFKIDTSLALSSVMRMCPKFFANPHGKREHISIYRGFLIARHTVQFTGERPKRLTALYLVAMDSSDTTMRKGDALCVLPSERMSTRQAQRVIDHILETGAYSFKS